MAAALFSGVIIMTEARCNNDIAILFFIDDSVCVIDSAAPPSTEIAFQRLGLSDSFIAISLDIFDERVDPLQQFFVPRLPKTVILPCFLFPK